MNEFQLNIEMDCYGPYYSEAQARYAQYLFTARYPDMAAMCSISPIDPDSDYIALINPSLLH